MARALDFSLLALPAPCFFSNSATAQSTSLLSKSSPPRWVSPPVALTYSIVKCSGGSRSHVRGTFLYGRVETRNDGRLF